MYEADWDHIDDEEGDDDDDRWEDWRGMLYEPREEERVSLADSLREKLIESVGGNSIVRYGPDEGSLRWVRHRMPIPSGEDLLAHTQWIVTSHEGTRRTLDARVELPSNPGYPPYRKTVRLIRERSGTIEQTIDPSRAQKNNVRAIVVCIAVGLWMLMDYGNRSRDTYRSAPSPSFKDPYEPSKQLVPQPILTNPREQRAYEPFYQQPASTVWGESAGSCIEEVLRVHTTDRR